MNFPLYTKTYSLSGRNYRRNPYNGRTNALNSLDAGDTADVYADDYEDEALDCIPDFQKHDESESEDNGERPTRAAETTKSAKIVISRPEVSTPANIAPPPGFEKKVSQPSKKEVAPTKEMKQIQRKEIVQKKEVVTIAAWIKCVEDERVEHNGEKWRAKIEVASVFYGRLIGTQRAVLNDMETGTNCRVKIPGRDDKSEIVEVSSTVSHENVIRCLERIEIIMFKARKAIRPTHFACLPINDPGIIGSFERFKELVKSSKTISDSCKDDRLFMLSRKLHLTITVMKLFTKKEKAKATETLKIAQERIMEISQGKPLSVRVAGLRIMNDDPASVDVLYGDVKGEFVQDVANAVRDVFAENQLCDEDKLDVKLHMTLMNSRYLAERLRRELKRLSRKVGEIELSDGPPPNKRPRLGDSKMKRTAFDAKALLQEMGDFNFGDITIDKVLICSMGTEGADGFYEALATLNL